MRAASEGDVLDIWRDGIAGHIVGQWNGWDYVWGATCTGDAPQVYRRRSVEMGQYGGWRYECGTVEHLRHYLDGMRSIGTRPRCGNAPRGSYGHECGSPAVVVRVVVPSTPGTYNPGGELTWTAHYCADCWAHGYEAADARRRAVSVERL